MGSVVSLEDDKISTNDLLKRLAGTESISDNDPYWNKLFSFNFNVPQWNRSSQKQFVKTISDFLHSLLYNTSSSDNFAALIKVFLRRVDELEPSAKCENKIFLWQTTNALIIIRYICVFFAERLSPTEFVNIFQSLFRADIGDDEAMNEELSHADNAVCAADLFLRGLINVLCNVPINDMTRQLHCENLRVILTLLSTQLYSQTVTEGSFFLQFLMRNRDQATDIVRILLENFLYETVELLDETRIPKTESLVISFASSMWSAFQKSVMVQADNTENDGDNSDNFDCDFPPQTLATLSADLLLNLICYRSFANKSNAYKDMLSLFQNAQEVSSLANLEASFKLDFTVLYNRLCASVDTEKLSMLLLYMLLHNNSGFRNFVLSRINLENLVLPCIKVLNNGIPCGNALMFRKNSHHTYLALIVILILSEDDFFCKIIHEMKLKNITWYQADRPISEISLGGLIVLVFVKIIHINTVKTRDRYLHTNSMAALANMSAYFKNLSSFVCQKLLGLLETMTKRQSKLIQQIVDHAENSVTVEHNGHVEYNNNTADANNDSNESMHPNDNTEEDEQSKEYKESLNQDISALEEGIRNILEIISACLVNNLRSNTDLIYGILYKRQLFELYKNHPFYEDLVWNIFAVINHFTAKIDAHCSSNASSSSSSLPSTPTSSSPIVSASGVMETIRKAAIEWPTDRLKKFPDLKFKYIEDDNTLDFFVPYVWRLVYQTSSIWFNQDAIKLHNVILTNDAI